jgi:hypothetical protein
VLSGFGGRSRIRRASTVKGPPEGAPAELLATLEVGRRGQPALGEARQKPWSADGGSPRSAPLNATWAIVGDGGWRSPPAVLFPQRGAGARGAAAASCTSWVTARLEAGSAPSDVDERSPVDGRGLGRLDRRLERVWFGFREGSRIGNEGSATTARH